MTKRETCEWATRVSVVWSKCLVPLPPCVSTLDRFADDVTCDRCPCWTDKSQSLTVDAQCDFCGKVKPFPGVIVPAADDPICLECIAELEKEEKEATDEPISRD